MEQPLDATYEGGVLRLHAPLPGIQEGQRVRVVVINLDDKDQCEKAFLDSLQEAGMIEGAPVHSPAPPKDWKPLVIGGEPLSETIITGRGPR